MLLNCGVGEVPWIARRSNPSIIKEINPEYHWKDWCWSSNILATWCEEPTHWKRPCCWERRKGRRRRRGCQRMRWLDGIIDSMDVSLIKLRGIVKEPEAWHATVHGVTKSQIQLSNWITTTCRRRQWHPTPVLLPGKSHGWRSLVGCSPWGR